MDLRDRIEIYIPAEAEVKSIPLWSLPNSVLKRMGLPLSDSNGSKKLTNSPKGTWICPAVIRKKSHKPGNTVLENALSLLRRECRASSGPFQMSFVFSNHTAFKVLKDTVPGSKLLTPLPRTSSLPQGLASKTYQTAVVIYTGRIYLSVRKPSQCQGHREKAQSAPQPLLKVGGIKSKKKELLNHKKEPKKKPTLCRGTHSPKKNLGKHKVKDVSSSTAARSVPHSAVGVQSLDSHCHEDAKAKQNPEEAAFQEPNWFHPQEEQSEKVSNSESGECVTQDLSSEVPESMNQNHKGDSDVQINTSEADQSSTQSWNRREPLGAACATTSQQSEFDFKELADEERISQSRARFKHNAQSIMAATSD